MALFAGIELPDRPDPENIRRLDLLQMPMLRKMSRYGFKIDVDHFRDLSFQLTTRMSQLRKDIIDVIPAESLDRFMDNSDLEDSDPDPDVIANTPDAPPPEFNVESSVKIAELLYDVLKLDTTAGVAVKKTKGGALTTGKKTLEQLKRSHVVVPLILEYREAAKLNGTYARPLPIHARVHTKGKDCRICGRFHYEEERRVHTTFTTTRAITGRICCVAGDTLLETSRGTFTFEEYEPTGEDLVLTHKGNQCKILRKFYKGLDKMYRVCLANGGEIKCTGGHRVFTPSGWRYVSSLSVGEKVYGVNFKTFYSGQEKCTEGAGYLSIRRSAYDGENSGTSGNYISHSDPYTENKLGSQTVRRRKEDSVFQGWGIQRAPVRSEPSELEGTGQRQQRVLDADRGRRSKLCTQESYVGSARHTGSNFTGHTSCASHRRKSVKQFSGQFSFGDCARAQRTTQEAYAITQITSLGTMATWDIEVEGDHSYYAGGMFHHNSKNPNLANIPARSKLGGQIRAGFICSRGYRIVQRDWAQIELRLMADRSGDPVMLDVYANDGDIHIVTAMKTFGIDDPANVDKLLHRAPSKNVNFSVCYLITGAGLLDLMAVTFATANKPLPDYMTEDWCNDFIQKWFGVYRGVRTYLDHEGEFARRYRLVCTRMGRVRRIPGVRSALSYIQEAGIREGCNHGIQGFSADLMKLALGEFNELLNVYASVGCECFPLMTIYDELLTEVPEDHCDMVQAGLGEIMDNVLVDKQTGILQCKVPIQSDGKIMSAWTKD